MPHIPSLLSLISAMPSFLTHFDLPPTSDFISFYNLCSSSAAAHPPTRHLQSTPRPSYCKLFACTAVGWHSDGRPRGKLQVFLFGFHSSDHSRFHIFNLKQSSAAGGLCGPITCVFIYFKWPINRAGLCQHVGQCPLITDHTHTHTHTHIYAYTNL